MFLPANDLLIPLKRAVRRIVPNGPFTENESRTNFPGLSCVTCRAQVMRNVGKATRLPMAGKSANLGPRGKARYGRWPRDRRGRDGTRVQKGGCQPTSRHTPAVRLFSALCLLPVLALFAAAPAKAEPRVALVIGNAAYRNASPLQNTIADSEAVAAALGRLGFSVRIAPTSARALMKPCWPTSRQGNGCGTGVFYYAGHGMELDGRTGPP